MITDHITVLKFPNISKWLLIGLNGCKGYVYSHPLTVSISSDPQQCVNNKHFSFNPTKFLQVCITMLNTAVKF